ncbi:MAG: hypothetical protein HOP28_05345 [Gemmatimonadales bacterium]|nr:hypothetical protein [Gemmatimonadales bacterium]
MIVPIGPLCMVGIALIAGCGARGEPVGGALPPVAAPLRLADSLVLTSPLGPTVWLTEGRQTKVSDSVTCIERTIEIRRDTARLKVPLLYTLRSPMLINDSTIEADLARDCRPIAVYRVNLRTAMPEKVRDLP